MYAKAYSRLRDIAVFAVFVAVVHFGAVAAGIRSSWWVNAEPWILLVALWCLLGWRVLQRRTRTSKSSAIMGFALLFGAVAVNAQQAQPSSVQSAATDTAVASAYKAADVWLDQLDGAQYGPSWDNASATFQHAVTRDQWVATVQRVRGQVGPLGARSLQEGKRASTAPNLPAGDYVTLQFRTVAANPAHVTETVVMERDGARGWRVIGYFVRP